MRIKLITKYEKDKLPFTKLKEFDITSLRGPRYMPKTLSEYIKNISD